MAGRASAATAAPSPSRRGRPAAATATTSGSIRRTPSATPSWTTAAARSTRTTASSACAFPNGQMYHVARRQPRAVLDLQQPAGRRHDARTVDELRDGRQRVPARGQHDAAGRRGLRARTRGRRRWWRRTRSRRGGPGGGCEVRGRGPWTHGAGHRLAAQHRRLRVGLHASRSDQRRHRLRELLRQQGDALGRAHRHRALDRAVDGVARLAAQRSEVPLPLDLADGDRSVRHEQRALRLPGDPEDVQRRTVVDRAQPGSFDQGSVADRLQRRPGRRQPRPVPTAKWCGRSSTRRSSAA